MSEKTCATCKFFDPVLDEDDGICRRHAPIIYALGDGNTSTNFPGVCSGDWCGDYERSPNERETS